MKNLKIVYSLIGLFMIFSFVNVSAMEKIPKESTEYDENKYIPKNIEQKEEENKEENKIECRKNYLNLKYDPFKRYPEEDSDFKPEPNEPLWKKRMRESAIKINLNEEIDSNIIFELSEKKDVDQSIYENGDYKEYREEIKEYLEKHREDIIKYLNDKKSTDSAGKVIKIFNLYLQNFLNLVNGNSRVLDKNIYDVERRRIYKLWECSDPYSPKKISDSAKEIMYKVAVNEKINEINLLATLLKESTVNLKFSDWYYFAQTNRKTDDDNKVLLIFENLTEKGYDALREYKKITDFKCTADCISLRFLRAFLQVFVKDHLSIFFGHKNINSLIDEKYPIFLNPNLRIDDDEDFNIKVLEKDFRLKFAANDEEIKNIKLDGTSNDFDKFYRMAYNILAGRKYRDYTFLEELFAPENVEYVSIMEGGEGVVFKFKNNEEVKKFYFELSDFDKFINRKILNEFSITRKDQIGKILLLYKKLCKAKTSEKFDEINRTLKEEEINRREEKIKKQNEFAQVRARLIELFKYKEEKEEDKKEENDELSDEIDTSYFKKTADAGSGLYGHTSQIHAAPPVV